MASPIAQFEIKPLVPLEVAGYNISFTNSSLFMVLAVVISTILFSYCLKGRKAVPTVGQSFLEVICEFIRGMIYDNIGKEGMKYFPFIFSIFVFIAFGNVLGLFPYSFTYTSHVSSVGCIALLALFINIWIGIAHKGWGWLHTFLPKGIPLAVGVILIPIEIVSLLSKPFSLTVRLVANMMVGHIMLKVIAGFVYGLGIFGAVPILFMGLIFIFESGIALLQAYIFTVLSCIYLGDSLHDH